LLLFCSEYMTLIILTCLKNQFNFIAYRLLTTFISLLDALMVNTLIDAVIGD